MPEYISNLHPDTYLLDFSLKYLLYNVHTLL